MKTEEANKIIEQSLLAFQGLLVFAAGIAVTLFFGQPEQRESRFPFLPQWRLEAGKFELARNTPSQTDGQSKSYPSAPVFVPAPLPSGVTASVTPTFIPDPPLTFVPPKPLPLRGKPVTFEKLEVLGIPMYRATINLKDPEVFITLSLPHDVHEANSASISHGDELFTSYVNRLHGAVVQNGTFFSKDQERRVMGNMVADGRWLKYSQWEDYGTTFGLKKGNEPEMVTARIEGKPDWREHWFSLTCGPRLVTHGEVIIDAQAEGFADPHVLGAGSRCALGYPATKDKLYLVTFLRGLTLKREGEVMQAMGCAEAMNLDGGASRALAHGKSIVVPAGRALTNVIVVYDTSHPAPAPVRTSWRNFQRNRAMIQLIQ